MVLRFVQVSDIHFGQEDSNGTVHVHEDVRAELIRDAGQIATARGAADLILVVGDTAYAGKKTEFDRAGEWLDALAKAIRCEPKAVRMVPGNHDCDRDCVKTVCEMVHKSIRDQSGSAANAALSKVAKDEPNPLLPKLAAYRDFAAGYESDYADPAAPYWTTQFDLPCGMTLRLVGLNTVQVCDKHDDLGKMILGSSQYVIKNDPDAVQVVLMHHPLHWLMDKPQTENYLHSRASLIMVGHEHIPKIQKATTAHHERIDLFSGATNPPEENTPYNYTYNWIELCVDVVDSTVILTVEIFARAWAPDQTAFVADTARMGGGGPLRLSVNCPRLKPRAQTIATGSPVTSPTAGVSTVTKAEANMDGSDDNYSMLKYLFWRRLKNWQERLKVLVEADALPRTAIKPVSEALERIALDSARANGRLDRVWDEMMKLLPPEHHHPNPYK